MEDLGPRMTPGSVAVCQFTHGGGARCWEEGCFNSAAGVVARQKDRVAIRLDSCNVKVIDWYTTQRNNPQYTSKQNWSFYAVALHDCLL